MPFLSHPYMDSLSIEKYRSLVSDGVWLGYHPETEDELHLPDSDRYAGTYMLGVQGNGKSALLQNLIAADMASGHAVIVIDPHSDLITSCLHHMPQSRLSHTYLLDM